MKFGKLVCSTRAAPGSPTKGSRDPDFDPFHPAVIISSSSPSSEISSFLLFLVVIPSSPLFRSTTFTYLSRKKIMSPKNSYDPEDGIDKSYVDNVEVVANADRPNPRKEAPAYVAGLSPEERQKAERALVRKIDIRLLPMLVIMYILNYLDRNNIVSHVSRVTRTKTLMSSRQLLGLLVLKRTWA